MNDDRDKIETLAAEYSLGTLDTPERRRARTRLASDRAFARKVEDWNRRLAPLCEAVAPLAPPPGIWPAIAATLATEHRAPLQAHARFWRWSTGGAVAIAASLVLYIALAPSQRALESRYVAVLESGPAMPAWLVSADMSARRMTVRPLGDLALKDKSYELWLIAGPGSQPRSFGLLNANDDRTISISVEQRAAVSPATAFAVSLEPAGGSPTGLPSGPVLYQGAMLPVAD